ncbi:hypothetical protein NDI49_04845 [Trichocoleus sp. ST-U3]|uniref:hypothetical protein n=1 Tax=Coleofasciculus sp. FACHB-542 TaxID=2692787 RepID=UPI0016864C9F|nr:hypothetical protein [Coleofasciculus sp. FACHB-542]MBD2087003.1 hypothetical protein [Coleofasciculus sp. FACHB-542]
MWTLDEPLYHNAVGQGFAVRLLGEFDPKNLSHWRMIDKIAIASSISISVVSGAFLRFDQLPVSSSAQSKTSDSLGMGNGSSK